MIAHVLTHIQQEVSLLVHMVRLADYMVCEGALALLLKSLEGLRDTFERRAVLLTQLSFDLSTPSLVEAAAASVEGSGAGGAGARGMGVGKPRGKGWRGGR